MLRSIVSICALLFLGPASWAMIPSELVRVRLASSLKEVEVEGQGLKVQGGLKSLVRIAIPKTEKLKIKAVVIAGKYFWQLERVQGNSSRTELISHPLLALEGTQLRQGAKSLPSKVFLSQTGGRIDLIGVLPLESYLVGVLASEMPLGWPLESLKAQAIAARSYALSVMKEKNHQLFQLESTVKDQVFRHVSQGVDHDPLIEKAFQAVKATEGMVLLDRSKKKVLKAFYHADCGGSTSSVKAVWGYGDSSPGVMDSSCPSNPRAQWNHEVSAKALTERLTPALKLPSEGVLVAALELRRQAPGLRADQVKLRLSDGSERMLLADTFRSLVGYSKVKSTKFEVEKVTERFVFRGKGFGHGVGLCQWGSRNLAMNKKSYSEILRHYYPQAEVR
jgi:stage II sporulation protein D